MNKNSINNIKPCPCCGNKKLSIDMFRETDYLGLQPLPYTVIDISCPCGRLKTRTKTPGYIKDTHESINFMYDVGIKNWNKKVDSINNNIDRLLKSNIKQMEGDTMKNSINKGREIVTVNANNVTEALLALDLIKTRINDGDCINPDGSVTGSIVVTNEGCVNKKED